MKNNATNLLKHFIGGCLLLFVGLSSFAQNTLQKGYIVKTNGDTLNGYIDYQHWQNTPDKIKFTQNASEKPLKYYPKDITYFGLMHNRYVSAKVRLEVSPHKIEDLYILPGLKFAEATVFLRTVFSGTKELYFLQDEKGKEHFYIKEGESFELLIYKEYLIVRDEKVFIKKVDTYKDQLAAYLADCYTLPDELNSMDYTLRDFKSIFQIYYSFVKQKPEFVGRYLNVNFKFGVMAGATLSTLDFSGPSYSQMENTNFSPSANFTGGLTINIIIPYTKGRMSINNELMYSTCMYQDAWSKTFGLIEDRYYVNMGFNYLNINNILRYKVIDRKVSLFLDLGISNTITLSSVNTIRHERQFFEDIAITQRQAVSWNGNDFKLLGGIGISYNRWLLALRYERGTPVSNNAISARTSLLLGYIFN